jgi:nucleoside 2-deoxyribosyltransferase
MNIDYKSKKRVYLASPYSHEDEAVRVMRFNAVALATAYKMDMGYVVYSPIVHSHVVAEYLDNALDHHFWLTQDASHIATCDKLTVYKLEGWNKSFGVTWEIGFANGLNIPVDYLETDLVLEWAEKKGVTNEFGV